MALKPGLVWLASYPKSGNTWFRIFLSNLQSRSLEPIDTNALQTGNMACDRRWMDDALGFDSALLTFSELDRLRPEIYRWYGENAKEVTFHKVHDANHSVGPEQCLVSPAGSRGVIYFIRNPLDVVVSFANHMGCSIDQSITHLERPLALSHSPEKQGDQLRQQILSWSDHVRSWTENSKIPLLVLRYEDMKESGPETFGAAVRFLELDHTEAEIARALDNSHIEKLQAQEAANGFREKPVRAKKFFRKGIVGDWQTKLTAEQVDRVARAHHVVMERYGYLP